MADVTDNYTAVPSTMEDFTDNHTAVPLSTTQFGGNETSTYAEEVRNWISIVFGLPVLITGVLGNVLTLVVLMSSRKFTSSSLGMLLILLSLCDIGVLSTGLLRLCIRGLTWEQILIRGLCQWCCKLHVYFTYVFLEMSPWTLCLVTLVRTVAVKHPAKVKFLCTRRRLGIAWFSIFVMVAARLLISYCCSKWK